MTWKLFYDAGCNLCEAGRLQVERWAERAGRPLQVLPLQGEEAQAKGYTGDLMVLEADRVLYGADAWLELARFAPWRVRWLSWARFTPPTRWLAALVYSAVARTRHRLFGRRACDLPPAPRG